MKKKIVLITGANGALGNFVTKAFLADGAIVVGASRTIKNAEFDHENFVAREIDLSDHQSAHSLIDSIVQEFGRIDVLVHTVGGFAGGATIEETDDATLERMFALNLHSAFYLLRAAVPAMRQNETGRIIAVGSRSGVEASPRAAVYGASKAALISLVKSAAAENKDTGITINAVLPGTIDTPQNRRAMPDADFSRWVSPASIAQAILWLASDAAANTNGALIPIYGRSL